MRIAAASAACGCSPCALHDPQAPPSGSKARNSSSKARNSGSSSAKSAAELWRQVRARMRRLTHDSGGDDRQPAELLKGVTLLHGDFWLEALDAQHRYGCHLRAFHRAWARDERSAAPFFCWLDHGRGRELDLPECSQRELRAARVVYCSREERRQFELRFEPSRLGVRLAFALSGQLAHTDESAKWIFVVDRAGRMYLGRKRKGRFHHSSFVAGAPIVAAGKMVVKQGRILAIEPHSGHFKPARGSLAALREMLERKGVDVDAIAFIKPKKWMGDWPFETQEASIDLEDFASDTDDGGPPPSP